MTKIDDVLNNLKSAFFAYLNSFFPFEYENKFYRLVNYYFSFPWIRCDICRSYPIQDVFVIRSDDGEELHVGKECIDQVTNRKVSDWFKEYETKRNNVITNRRYIDGIDSILSAYNRNELACKISESDINRLKNTLEHMCNGFNATRQEEQLSECYMRLDRKECKIVQRS